MGRGARERAACADSLRPGERGAQELARPSGRGAGFRNESAIGVHSPRGVALATKGGTHAHATRSLFFRGRGV